MAPHRLSYPAPRLPRPPRTSGVGRHWLLLALVFCLPIDAQAHWRVLAPGQSPDPASAVLLLVIDSDLALGQIVLRREGQRSLLRLRPDLRADALPLPVEEGVEGSERGLLVLQLEPGDYRLVRIELADRRLLDLPAGLRRAIELRAGELVYPGDLRIAEVAGSEQLRRRWENRSSRWLPLLHRTHPELLATRPIRYEGRGVDPFPAQWQAWMLEGRLGDPGDDHSATAPQPEVPPAALTRALFRPPALALVSLSPDGHWLALGERADQALRLVLVDAASAVRHPTGIRLDADARLLWCGPDCLAVSRGAGRAGRVEVLRLEQQADALRLRRLPIDSAGYVVDPLPQDPDSLLFGRLDDPTGKDAIEVYRLRLEPPQIHTRQLHRRHRLDGVVRNELGWLSDTQGQLRLALGRSADGYQLLQPTRAGDPAPLLETPLSTHLDALAIVDDALLALTDADLPSRQLRRYPLDGSAPTTLAAISAGDSLARMCHEPPAAAADHPVMACPVTAVDLVGVVLGYHDRQPLALRHFDRGMLRSSGIDAPLQQRLDELQQHHPGAALNLARVSADGSHWLYFLDRPGDPAAASWWLQRAAGETPTLVGRLRPWLDCPVPSPHASALPAPAEPWCRDGPLPPLRSEVLILRSAEGWPLEAYLTLPPQIHGPERPLPLLLLPHGGPLGVRDHRGYDPLVQLLARAGFALLQVNYRGSLGYGRAFRDAAFGEVGAAIEGDLLSALDQLRSDPRLDLDRVCSVGTSYGGYSALMLAILRPGQVRCVATYAAPTDLLLRFVGSDWNDDPLQRALQERLYGDPATDLARLQARSPLYRYEALTQPLLIGHGLRDRRVHPEHADRLALLLRGAGRAPEAQFYANEGHALQRVENQIDWYNRVLAFLQREIWR